MFEIALIVLLGWCALYITMMNKNVCTMIEQLNNLYSVREIRDILARSHKL